MFDSRALLLGWERGEEVARRIDQWWSARGSLRQRRRWPRTQPWSDRTRSARDRATERLRPQADSPIVPTSRATRSASRPTPEVAVARAIVQVLVDKKSGHTTGESLTETTE